jgi:CRP-like cAMP-binding protein
MPTDHAFLESIDLFAELDPQMRKKIAAHFETLRITGGEVLIRRGEAAEVFYVLFAGQVMVYYREGRALVLTQRGDLLGCGSVVQPFRYAATAVALTDGELLRISAPRLRALIDAEGPAGGRIFDAIQTVLAERRAVLAGVPGPDPA